MDGYPCVKITEADLHRAASIARSLAGPKDRWIDDRQLPKDQLRQNGLIAEAVAFRMMPARPHRAYWRNSDNGIDFWTTSGSWDVKFRSANHYGLSRPVHTIRMRADFILLIVPACSYLDRKPLREGDEICLAGWISTADFYARAQRRAFFGKEHLFLDQPFAPVHSHPDIR